MGMARGSPAACMAMASSAACCTLSCVMPPMTTVPLSSTSGRSVEVRISTPQKPSMALSSLRVPLSDSTTRLFICK